MVAHPNTTLGLAVRFGTDVLSGLPSIVVGLFVYTLFVIGRGYSALAGSFALAVFMLPVVVRTTEEMLKLVPKSLREASLALGAPEWKTSFSVMLPAAVRRRHRLDAGHRTRGRRDRAAALYGAGQQQSIHGTGQADGLTAVDVVQVCGGPQQSAQRAGVGDCV